MLKQVDNLYHFTGGLTSLYSIIEHGFYPSYTKENLGERNILVAMISFSNVLLRDIGDKEVLSYGSYALGFDRAWGISNHVNPVTYTFKDGILYDAVNTFLFGSLFLHALERYKDDFKHMSTNKIGPFSKLIHLTNTPPEVMDILDCLSTNYDENMFNAIMQYADMMYRSNLSVVALTKSYMVRDSQSREFVAYNDREWRKIYMNLNTILEENPEYEKWSKTPKPHYPDPTLSLKFSLEDLKAILVSTSDELISFTEYLKQRFDRNNVEKRMADGSLIVGTQDDLIKAGL